MPLKFSNFTFFLDKNGHTRGQSKTSKYSEFQLWKNRITKIVKYLAKVLRQYVSRKSILLLFVVGGSRNGAERYVKETAPV